MKKAKLKRTTKGDYIIIKYKPEKAVSKRLRQVKGYRYNRLTKIGKMPYSLRNARLLKKLNFVFSIKLMQYHKKVYDKKYPIKKVPGLKEQGLELRKYQMIGVNKIERFNGAALLADDMGLGKTPQALCWVRMHEERFPVLVLCPSNLKVNWKREIERWTPGKTSIVLEGMTPYEFGDYDFVIINYHILYHWRNHLKKYGFRYIIADESHYIKNNEPKRTKAAKLIRKYVDSAMCISGTPIENHPIEIYNQVRFCNPSVFTDHWEFVTRYCNPTQTPFGWDKTGHSNVKELNRILKSKVMIRRKKSDVAKELPPKILNDVTFEINNEKEYRKAEHDFINYVDEKFTEQFNEQVVEKLSKELLDFAKQHGIEGYDFGDHILDEKEIEKLKQEKLERIANAPVLAQLQTLMRLAMRGKIDSVVEWIENFLVSEEKLVVFTMHREAIEKLMKKFPNAVKLEGGMSPKKKQQAIDSFQNDPKVKLFFVNLMAGREGLTLTAASNAMILQYPWSPKKMRQAEDRIHRITQQKTVNIWRVIALNTIEERIIKLMNDKEDVIDSVIDGKEASGTNMLVELIKSYRRT